MGTVGTVAKDGWFCFGPRMALSSYRNASGLRCQRRERDTRHLGVGSEARREEGADGLTHIEYALLRRERRQERGEDLAHLRHGNDIRASGR